MSKSSAFAAIGMTFLYVVLSVGIFSSLDEDAFISFRYADQFLAGNGLVFNQGSMVEGFSNFLWIVILLPFKALGFSLITISRLLGMIFGLGSAFMVVRFTRRLIPEEHMLIPWATGFWYILSIPVIWWSQSGLETSLIAFELLALAYCLAFDRKSWFWGAFWMVLSAMTRPEAHLFVPFYALWIIKQKPAVSATKGLAVVAVSLGIYHLLRYSYYGYFLPTPAAMKADGLFASGLAYLKGFFMSGHYCWAIPFLVRSVASRKQRSATLPLQIMVFGYLFFIFFVGGDYKVHFRFAVPLLAPFMILSVLGVHMMSRIFTRRWQEPIARLAICVLILLPLVFYKGWGEPRPSRSLLAKGLSSWGDHARSQMSTHTTNYDYVYHPYLGKWINENLPHTTRIVYEQMGQVPYFAGIDYCFMDLGGLTDRYIADRYRDSRPSALCTLVVQVIDQVTMGRARGLVSRLQSLCHRGDSDAMHKILRHVLSHKPEVIMVTGLISQWRPWKDLWSDPSFRNQYILTHVFGYRPGAYPEFAENFDVETLNTILFFRRDFNAAHFPAEKYGFNGVTHNLFCHYCQQDEVVRWIGIKYPDLLPLTR